MKKLISLEDANARARANYETDTRFHLNGIACPTCGKEMVDSDPYVTLTSDPPQKAIACEGCGYRGYRIV